METLRRIHALPPHVADALARKDAAALGRMLDAGWRLKKTLTPEATNEAIEDLVARVRPFIDGVTILGAGSGGFALMACRSGADAARVREMLTADPPNPRARFFDFSVSREGLVVTVC
jgi:galactokinase/mevalonate kinase-like predicted kinase